MDPLNSILFDQIPKKMKPTSLVSSLFCLYSYNILEFNEIGVSFRIHGMESFLQLVYVMDMALYLNDLPGFGSVKHWQRLKYRKTELDY